MHPYIHAYVHGYVHTFGQGSGSLVGSPREYATLASKATRENNHLGLRANRSPEPETLRFYRGTSFDRHGRLPTFGLHSGRTQKIAPGKA